VKRAPACAVAAALVAVAALAAPPAHADEFSDGFSHAMQADVRGALPHFAAAARTQQSAARNAITECIVGRFEHHVDAPVPAELDQWTREVLATYRRYWTRVMMKEVAPDIAERELAQALARLAAPARDATPPADLDALEAPLGAKIEALGWHALFGVTAPLREFMLWHTQSDEAFDVDLPSGREHVHVVWLDGFASLGWTAFATCERAHTGGWTKPDRLYAVRESNDVASEAFKVSYLMHEGQHFVDHRRCPALAQPELEYRAKLVELANAQATLYDLLEAFEDNESTDRGQPHPWANRLLIEGMSARLLDGAAPGADTWKRIAPQKINAAARALFDEDTAQRVASGACKASG
jgi:hypothetical protein